MPSTIIQLAIGVVFVFFLLGSACSFLNELVAATLDRRAAHLEAWIYKMLGRDLAKRFFTDPRIVALRRPRAGGARRTDDEPKLALDQAHSLDQARLQRQALNQARLRRSSEGSDPGAAEPSQPRPSRLARLLHPERKVPSYIEPDTFARTLLAILQEPTPHGEIDVAEAAQPANAERPSATTRRRMRRLWGWLFPTRPAAAAAGGAQAAATAPLTDLVAKAPKEWPKDLLSALVEDASGKPDAFLERSRKWFEEEMNRLSGWYKRRTKLFLLLFGAMLAVTLNVDSVLITRTLWNDPTVRATVVTQAQQLTSTSTVPPTTAAGTVSPGTTSTTSCPTRAGSTGTATTTTTDPLDCVAARIQKLRSLQLPIGWPTWPWHWPSAYAGNDPRFPHEPGGVPLKLFGLIVTALAAAQGGPFWFDLLGKLINPRGTGPPSAP